MPWTLSKHLINFSYRDFHLSTVNLEQVPKVQPSANEDMNTVPLRSLDKILLVWSGKYKSRKEVPDRLPRPVLSKCHSVCRVKVCNYMIVITLVAAFFYAMSGKRDSRKGLTVAEMNRQWHQEQDRKFEKESKNS